VQPGDELGVCLGRRRWSRHKFESVMRVVEETIQQIEGSLSFGSMRSEEFFSAAFAVEDGPAFRPLIEDERVVLMAP
jgi:hypothetical protein